MSKGIFSREKDGDVTYYPNGVERSYNRLHVEWSRAGSHGLFLRTDSRPTVGAIWSAGTSVIIGDSEDVATLAKKMKKLDLRTEYPIECSHCGGKGRV